MTQGEFIYLSMVLIAFATFGLGVGWVSWWSGRKRPSATDKATWQADIVELTIRQQSSVTVQQPSSKVHSPAA